MEKSIELDCAPGYPRPGDLIGGVVEGLDLEVKEPVSTFFGCWKWVFEVSDEKWEEIRPTLKARVSVLFKQGAIRYGSW